MTRLNIDSNKFDIVATQMIARTGDDTDIVPPSGSGWTLATIIGVPPGTTSGNVSDLLTCVWIRKKDNSTG